MIQLDVNNIALIITVIALGLALWQLKSAHVQVLKLDEIQKALSTRYLDEFPAYLPHIIEIISNAKKEVTIVCDVPAFAGFIDSANWLHYRQIIERKIHEGVTIDLICYNGNKRCQIHSEQFAQARENWNHWIKDPKIFSKLETFLRNSVSEKNIDNLTYQDFEDMIENLHKSAIQYSFSGARIYEVEIDLTNYFWIVDKNKALFAIPTYSKPKHGFLTYGFVTSDPRFISALISLKERYKNLTDF